MVVGHSSASCQTELRVVLFCGTDADVVIELKPVWAWFLSSDEGGRLHPMLTGSVKVSRVKFDELDTPEDGVAHDSLSKVGARLNHQSAHDENLATVRP